MNPHQTHMLRRDKLFVVYLYFWLNVFSFLYDQDSPEHRYEAADWFIVYQTQDKSRYNWKHFAKILGVKIFQNAMNSFYWSVNLIQSKQQKPEWNQYLLWAALPWKQLQFSSVHLHTIFQVLCRSVVPESRRSCHSSCVDFSVSAASVSSCDPRLTPWYWDQGCIPESRFSENSAFVHPEMRETLRDNLNPVSVTMVTDSVKLTCSLAALLQQTLSFRAWCSIRVNVSSPPTLYVSSAFISGGLLSVRIKMLVGY